MGIPILRTGFTEKRWRSKGRTSRPYQGVTDARRHLFGFLSHHPARSHLKNPLGCGSLRYEIASSSGENVLAVSQRKHLRAFSPCILALS
jgi:hypothetical protein